MNEALVKMLAVLMGALSGGDGVPVAYVSAHDGDTITVGFRCNGPVTATVSFAGLTDLPAGAPPLVRKLECRKGVVEMPVRISGIDTPEISGSPCNSAAERAEERRQGIVARDKVRGLLKAADRVLITDLDPDGEKWDRMLGRVLVADKSDSELVYDLGGRLVLEKMAVPYSGGTKTPWCGR